MLFPLPFLIGRLFVVGIQYLLFGQTNAHPLFRLNHLKEEIASNGKQWEKAIALTKAVLTNQDEF